MLRLSRSRLLLIQDVIISDSALIDYHLIIEVNIEQELGLVLLQDVDLLASGAAAAGFEDTEGVLEGVLERVLLLAVIFSALRVGPELNSRQLVTRALC